MLLVAFGETTNKLDFSELSSYEFNLIQVAASQRLVFEEKEARCLSRAGRMTRDPDAPDRSPRRVRAASGRRRSRSASCGGRDAVHRCGVVGL